MRILLSTVKKADWLQTEIDCKDSDNGIYVSVPMSLDDKESSEIE